jgi:transposase InsO family protein
MNAPRQARSSTSTSRSWENSIGSVTGSAATGVGWEYVHLAIDDHSRLAYSEILPDEKRASCLRFLFNALRFFQSLGVKVERVMTDNGVSFRSFRYAKALRRLRIKHLRTKPYTPKTNGKAERFVQTSLREWAYARSYNTSDERAAELPFWLHRYNWHRPHGAIGAKPPISRHRAGVDHRAVPVVWARAGARRLRIWRWTAPSPLYRRHRFPPEVLRLHI